MADKMDTGVSFRSVRDRSLDRTWTLISNAADASGR